jgi:hypothetical protein
VKRTLLILGVVAALGVCGDTALANECQGVKFPEQIQAARETLVLNGLGLRQATMFKVDVYVAALYLTTRSSNANAILGSEGAKKLVLQFVREVSDDELSDAWEDGFKKNAKKELPKLQHRIVMLNRWMSDVKVGEQLSFLYEPGAGIHVDVNGTRKGTIPGDDFARPFFSIWLGNKPPNAGIKEGLLGGACE